MAEPGHGYTDWRFVDGPGRATIVQPEPGADAYAVIFTDDADAVGVAYSPGADPEWQANVATYIQARAAAGEEAVDVFDTLAFMHSQEVYILEDLHAGLAGITGEPVEEDE